MTRKSVILAGLLLSVLPVTGSGKSGSSTVFVATLDRGVMRSSNGGANWIQSNAGLPHGIGSTAVIPVIAIADAGKDGRHVYALTETAGVFRWNSVVAFWENASSGLPVPFFHRTEGSLLSVHPSDGNRVYTLLNVPVNSHRDQRLLFGSVNGGRSWSLLKDLGSTRSFLDMTIDEKGRLTLTSEDGNFERFDTPELPSEDGFPINLISLLGDNSARGSFGAAGDVDTNNIAVIEDDGSLVGKEFDLSNRSFEFRPAIGGGYDVAAIAPAFDEDVGDAFTLGDEDSRFIQLPFSFSFYGSDRNSVFINSNGNLTFLQKDLDSVATIDKFNARAPRIAPLWADFDPTRLGKVSLKAAADRVVVSWVGVPIFLQTTPNTLQVVLRRDGTIRFNYKDLAAKTGITGIANGYQLTSQQVVFSDISALRGTDVLPIVQRFRTPDIDIVRLAQRFYLTHDDDFDALVVFGASQYQSNIASGGGAYFAGVKNDAVGVGLSRLDSSALLGSAGRLQGMIDMNRLSQYPDDITRPIPDTPDAAITILGQEWGHRFGAYVRFRDGASASSALLGRSSSHWSYFLNSEASVIEGNEWRDNGDGSFTATDVVRRYSKLDQYLMGFRGPAEVSTVMLITNPQPVFRGNIGSFVSTMGLVENGIRDSSKNFGLPDELKAFWLRVALTGSASSFASAFISSSGKNDAGPAPDMVSTPVNNLRQLASTAVGLPYEISHIASSGPHARYFDPASGGFTGDNITIRGTRRDIPIESIIENEGERLPPRASAPKAFRHAFILVIPPGTKATASDLARIDIVRRGWESFYRQATDGIGSVSTELQSGLSRMSRQLAARGMTTLTTRGVSSAANVGYGALDIGTDRTTGVTFLTGRVGDRIVTETAEPALGALRRASVYAERRDSVNTGIAMAAPLGASTVSLQLRNTDGTLATSASLDLPAGSQAGRFLNELFPAYSFPAAFRGTLTVVASAPIVIVALRTTVNESGEFLMTTVPAVDLGEPTLSTSYLAHFADGGGYITEAILINTEAAPITGSLEWRSTSGALLGTAARYSIPASGTQLLSSGAGDGTLRTGYVVVRADTGQTGPAVRSIIQLRQNGRLVGLTGIYPSPPARRSQTFVDVTEGHDSGVALLNDGAGPAVIRLTVYNNQGSALPGTATLTLAARTQTASFVSQLFPSLPRGFRGAMEMSSDSPIQAMALRSTSTTDRFLIAALPVESLDARRNDAVLYFPQIVDGGGFSSEIFLMNLGGTIANPRLSLVSPQGQPIKMEFIQPR